MNINIPQGTVQLANGASAQVEQVCGSRVDVLEGTAWITIDGDPRDIVLTGGSSFVIDSNAPVMLTALASTTRFMLSASDPTLAPCQKRPGVLRGLLASFTHRPVNDALAAAL